MVFLTAKADLCHNQKRKHPVLNVTAVVNIGKLYFPHWLFVISAAIKSPAMSFVPVADIIKGVKFLNPLLLINSIFSGGFVSHCS